MKKLFLRDGKLWYNEFPEEPIWHLVPNSSSGDSIVDNYNAAVSAAKASAVEVVNIKDVWLNLYGSSGFLIHAAKEGQLYDTPEGWTVEIDNVTEEGVSVIRGSKYKKEGETELKDVRKVARLIPLKEQSSGIAAVGVAEYGELEPRPYLEENKLWNAIADQERKTGIPESGETQPKRRAVEACAKWLAYCLEIGYTKNQLDELERIWWMGHDENGNLKPVSPPPQESEENEEDLWRELFTLYIRAGSSQMYAAQKEFTIARKAKP